MDEKVMQIIHELVRLQVVGKVEFGEYEASFLGDTPDMIEVSVWCQPHKVPVDDFLNGLQKLPFDYGNLEVIKQLCEQLMAGAK